MGREIEGRERKSGKEREKSTGLRAVRGGRK